MLAVVRDKISYIGDKGSDQHMGESPLVKAGLTRVYEKQTYLKMMHTATLNSQIYMSDNKNKVDINLFYCSEALTKNLVTDLEMLTVNSSVDRVQCDCLIVEMLVGSRHRPTAAELGVLIIRIGI